MLLYLCTCAFSSGSRFGWHTPKRPSLARCRSRSPFARCFALVVARHSSIQLAFPRALVVVVVVTRSIAATQAASLQRPCRGTQREETLHRRRSQSRSQT